MRSLAMLVPFALFLVHCSSAEPTTVAGDDGTGGSGDQVPAGGDDGTATGDPSSSASPVDGTPTVADDAGAGNDGRAPGAYTGTPRTCAEVLSTGAGSTDGTYEIDPDGDGPIASLHVWCAGMKDATKAPREYISLGPNTKNEASFAGGGYCDCPTFTRTFTKVRFDPAHMQIDADDLAFATANRDGTCDTGKQNCQGPGHTFFATPGSCVTNSDASGSAHVDFTGTEIHVDTQMTFGGQGYLPGGSATVSADRKQVSMTGGGACGWWGPSPANRLTIARD